MTAQTWGSPLSCRNASQSPSRLRAHYYKRMRCIISPHHHHRHFSFGWHGESVIKVLLSFCGAVGELVVVPVGTSNVGQISCILVWVLHFFLALAEKAPPAAVKDGSGDKRGKEKRGGRHPHSEF